MLLAVVKDSLRKDKFFESCDVSLKSIFLGMLRNTKYRRDLDRSSITKNMDLKLFDPHRRIHIRGIDQLEVLLSRGNPFVAN